MKTIAERADAYLKAMPVSVSGQGGHRSAFSAAVALVRGFSLSEQEAFPILARWNAGCLPPWGESELRHKLRSAATSGTRPQGYLLREDEAPPPHAASAARDFETEDERKARLRQAWPPLTALTPEDIDTIARLRGILPDAVDLAHRHGFVKAVTVQGHRCYALAEDRFVQVRRLDGLPLLREDGTPLKARNFSGSQGAFIGRRWLAGTTHVLLVEGAVGLLEGLAALLLVDTAHAWSVLAATSASSRFARDPGLLELLRGRRVRIVPDADEAGRGAAASWISDLDAAGVPADIVRLPGGSKDLGDFLRSSDPQPVLNRIFEIR